MLRLQSKLVLGGFLLALTQLAGFAPARADESEDLIRKTRAEAPEGWAKLEAMQSALDATLECSSTDAKGTVSWELSWRRCHGCLLVEKKDKDGRRAVVSNPDYYFTVSQSARSPAKWRLRKVETNIASRESANRKLATFLIYGFYINPATSFTTRASRRLSELLKDPTFTVERAEMASPFVRLHVHYDEVFLSFPKSFCKGTIVLDPAMNWAVREFVSITDDRVLVAKNEFSQREINGYKPVSSATVSIDHPKRPNDYTRLRVTLKSIRVCDSPTETFRLTAFNLPEPFIHASSRTSRTIGWLLAGAILASVLAFLCRRLAQRKPDTAERRGPEGKADAGSA